MICPKCLRDCNQLTRDHIVPKFFVNKIDSLGIDMPKYLGQRYQKICQECNQNKGGAIHWEHPVVRTYMETLARKILERLENTKSLMKTREAKVLYIRDKVGESHELGSVSRHEILNGGMKLGIEEVFSAVKHYGEVISINGLGNVWHSGTLIGSWEIGVRLEDQSEETVEMIYTLMGGQY